MDCIKTGQLIVKRRKELGLTQIALAQLLCVSDKTISKWERGAGCPDITLIRKLAEVLEVNTSELLSGEIIENNYIGGNMKRIKFYVCETCGNVISSTNDVTLSCCGGKKLEALEAHTEIDEAHMPQIEVIEDDLFVTFNHPMTKAHTISFVAYVTFDKLHLMKLYPEQNPEVRFCKRGRGTLYVYCTEHGLWAKRI
ncbi:MAG: helix-turn-helix domain-containing protein [Cellulosilyticaceae bacterium]